MASSQYRWRMGARIVGYIDLVISGLGLLFGIFLLLGTFALTVIILGKYDEDLPEKKKMGLNGFGLIILVWIVTGFTFSALAIQVVAAARLVRSTKLGCHQQPQDALRLARFWRNVTILFVVLHFFAVFAGVAALAGTLIWLIIRGVFLYNVLNFMKELEAAAATSVVCSTGTTQMPPATTVVWSTGVTPGMPVLQPV